MTRDKLLALARNTPSYNRYWMWLHKEGLTRG